MKKIRKKHTETEVDNHVGPIVRRASQIVWLPGVIIFQKCAQVLCEDIGVIVRPEEPIRVVPMVLPYVFKCFLSLGPHFVMAVFNPWESNCSEPVVCR